MWFWVLFIVVILLILWTYKTDEFDSPTGIDRRPFRGVMGPLPPSWETRGHSVGGKPSRNLPPYQSGYKTGVKNLTYAGCFQSTTDPHTYPTLDKFHGTKTLQQCADLARANGHNYLSMRDSTDYKRGQCWTGKDVKYTYYNTRCTGQGNDSYGRNFGGLGQDAFYYLHK